MAQDVEIPVVRADPEIDGLGRVPLVLDGLDFKHVSAERESLRALIGPIPGVAFHSNLAHRAPLRPRGLRPPVYAYRTKLSARISFG